MVVSKVAMFGGIGLGLLGVFGAATGRKTLMMAGFGGGAALGLIAWKTATPEYKPIPQFDVLRQPVRRTDQFPVDVPRTVENVETFYNTGPGHF